MIKTFTQAVKFIESYIPTEKEKHPGQLGLKRMKYLMGLLDNPHLRYPTIHVGGTSGKGSTATIIAYILGQRYKVGLHTSPHLEKITERIKILKNIKYQISRQRRGSPKAANIKYTCQKSKIDKEDISENEFIDLANEILPTIDNVEKSKFGRPTYFEITTALAFMAFAKAGVDIAVVEVGMGGRFDATNVVKPKVAVITNVGLDHTEVLGRTVEEIVRDKVGIIKKNIVVVSGVKQVRVIRIIRKRCERKRTTLSLLNNALPTSSPRGNAFAHPRGGFKAFSYQIKSITSDGSVFNYFGEKSYRNLKLSLLGKHQVENAGLAIRTIELINKPITQSANKPINKKKTNYELRITNYDIRKTLRTVFIPGKLEIVSEKPLVILDGAHNPDKMKALVESIKEIFPQKKVTAVVAIKKEKDARTMFSYLLPICRKVILTKFRLTTDLGETFSYEPRKLLKIIRSIDRDKQVAVIKDPKKAIAYAIKSDSISSPRGSHGFSRCPSGSACHPVKGRGPHVALRSRGGFEADDLTLVTGSLYLVGEVRKKI